MGTRTEIYCDICRAPAGPGETYGGEPWHGKVNYRVYGPGGLSGERIDLCAKHASEVYWFIWRLKNNAQSVDTECEAGTIGT